MFYIDYEEFDEITEGQEDNDKEKYKSKWSRLEAVVGSPSRIKKLAEDIVNHYEEKAKTVDGKAMVVCMSRKICVDLYDEIIKLRPDWHSDDVDKGKIKVVSNIACEYIITSDKEFFKTIGEEETKRYFETAYKFVSEYKNLGEQYILSAKVHMDEQSPHMHLIFLPVVHTKDKKGNDIDKLACSEFWKAKDSYRQLQNAFYDYMVSNGFELERGLPKEETGREHIDLKEYKEITNFEKTKETLKNIKLELPNVPNIDDININRLSKKRDEKILEEIIKPKDDVIQNLYKDNLNLHRELSRQTKIIEKAEKYQKERDSIITDNEKLHNQVENIQAEYKEKEFDMEWKYKSKIKSLEKENNHLHKVVDKFYETLEKFIDWICQKFGIGESKELVRKFEKETNMYIDPDKQLKKEERAKEWDLEI